LTRGCGDGLFDNSSDLRPYAQFAFQPRHTRYISWR